MSTISWRRSEREPDRSAAIPANRRSSSRSTSSRLAGDRRRFDRSCRLHGCRGGSSSACRVRRVVPTVVVGVGRSPSRATHTASACRCSGARTSASGSRRQASAVASAMWTSKPRSTPLSMISPTRKFATRSPPLRRRACGWGRGAAWLLGREPRASQAQKARATIALATARTCAGSARDHCIVFR